MNMKPGNLNYGKRIFAAALSVLLIFCAMFFFAPNVFADDSPGQPVQSPLPSDGTSPQPSVTPEPSETPQPTETPSAQEPSPSPEIVGTLPDGSDIVEVDGMKCVEGEVIVKFKDSVSQPAIASTLDSVDSEVTKDLPGDSLLVTDVPEGETVESFIDTMEEKPGVEFAQPNYIYSLDKTTNDPYANSSYQWYLDTIDAYDAWNITTGSGILIADLDTGIDLSHAEFSGQIASQWDFVNNDDTAQDDYGHGTFTAGIIAAKAGNGIGISGIAPDAKLIVVKVLDSEGYGTSTDIYDGINYAVSHGARVINMSFGGYGRDYLEEGAIDNAVSAGVVCVAAAGNEDTTEYVSPSDYSACISVIATDRSGERAWYSNYGPNKDISAPGTDIYSTKWGGGYDWGTGTSAAAPIVTATAALVLSASPDLSVSQVKNVLYNTATYAGSSYYFGHGLVNAYAAVRKALAPNVTAVSAGYESVSLTWSEVDSASGYEVWRCSSSDGSYSHISSVPETSYTDHGLKAGTTYYYKVRAYYSDSPPTTYGSLSNYASAKPLPAAPSSITAGSAGYSSIRVSWNAVTGASGYRIYRSSSSTGTYSLIKTTSALSFTDKNLKTGAEYFYKVRAYTGSSSASGVYSDAASASPALSSIEWANAFSYYPTSINLNWDPVPGKSGYEIWRSVTSGSGFEYIKSASSASYKNTSLIPFQTYYYKIVPYRKVNGRKVYGEYTTEISSTPILNDVTGASASMRSVTSNRISWNAVSGRSGYEIVRCDAGGGSEQHLKFTTSTYFNDTGLIPNQVYYYKVRAYSTVGSTKYYSEYSPVVQAEPAFGDVSGVMAVSYTAGSVRVSWNPVSGASGYEILRSDTPGGEYGLITSTVKTYYVNSSLEKGKTYYYKVRAYVLVGGVRQYSGESEAMSAAAG